MAKPVLAFLAPVLLIAFTAVASCRAAVEAELEAGYGRASGRAEDVLLAP